MIRSVSPIDFDLALKFLNIIALNPGLDRNEILPLLHIKEGSSKFNSIITDFNDEHINLVVREKKNRYRLNIFSEKIPPENSNEENINIFWREQFLNFPLYIEILQSFSFGKTIEEVSKFTGVSLISTRELARWAKMVGDLEEIEPEEYKDRYKITNRSIEELLNRIAVCQLGNLGCSKIKREKQLKESGMKVDVYGFDKKNTKEYFIESESSAINLQNGINQAHTWISKNKNIEKWVLIPHETLKELTFETLKKRYITAKNRGILIKLCNLNFRKRPKIINLKIPSPKDMKIFDEILKLFVKKNFIISDEIKQLIENTEAFLKRIKRFGLITENSDRYFPLFKI